MADLLEELQHTEVIPVPALHSNLIQKQMPGLDILRGIAVLAVLMDHGLTWDVPKHQSMTRGAEIIGQICAPGWLGVNLFFVLSGFLITGILLDTKHRKHYWRDFYTRRMLRILPLYLVTIAVLSWKFSYQWKYILLTLVFMANWANLRADTIGPVYSPLWSLAVEEQFYLFWPLLIRRVSRRALFAICIAVIVICPVLRGLSVRSPWLGDTYSTTWLVCDNLAWGALIATFLRTPKATAERVRALTVGLALAAILLLPIMVKFHWVTRKVPMGAALSVVPFELLFTSILLLALRFGRNRWILAASAPVRFFGYISYGFYMTNLFFFYLYDDAATKLMGPVPLLTSPLLLLRFAVVMIFGSAFCYVSRRYFEDKFLSLKEKLAPYGDGSRKRA